MRQIIILILFFQLVSIGLYSQTQISFNKTEHNFGTILWNEPVRTEFQVTNTGISPLVLSNVTVSCACAITDWTKSPIEPGKTGTIKAVFDAKALGRFEKFIEIYSNATPEPAYLTIKGRVATVVVANENDFPFRIGSVGIDKNNIEFSDSYWGEVVEEEINVMNFSDKEYVPNLMHLPSYLTAEYSPTIIPKNGVGKIRLKLDTRFLRSLGLNQTSVYLARFLGDKVGEENEIVISSILLPEASESVGKVPVIHLSENVVDLGSFGKKEKLSHTILITNNGQEKLEISKLQVFNPAISVSSRKRYIEPGGNTKLKITLSKKDLIKTKSAPKILIITNDPNNPKIIIDLKATID